MDRLTCYAKTAELNHGSAQEEFVLNGGCKTGWMWMLMCASFVGCREPTPCEKEARLECEETLETINYFNEMAGRERYTLEDCYQIIPYRCPDSF